MILQAMYTPEEFKFQPAQSNALPIKKVRFEIRVYILETHNIC